MYISDIGPEIIAPVLIFAIPIIAIVGGISAGIVRTIGRQRLVEMAQRERIAAIERGIDPSKLPALPFMDDDQGVLGSGEHSDRRRAQGLMVGGIVTTAVGIGIAVFLYLFEETTGEKNIWAVGVVPTFVGLALLLSSWLVRPKNGV
jgi:hypothetical protein